MHIRARAFIRLNIRVIRHPILGPKFGLIPNAKKYVFFPIQQKKFPAFFFGPPSLFHIMQNAEIYCYLFTISQNNRIQSLFASFSPFSHSTLISIHYSSLIIGINLAMETSYIRTMSNFPILVKTPLIFPIPWAPALFPKRGVRALNIGPQCIVIISEICGFNMVTLNKMIYTIKLSKVFL